MAIVKFDLSLRVRMDINFIRICECTATLYHGVTRVPVLTSDLYLDRESCSILKDVCKRFRGLAMNNIFFIDCDVHALSLRYSCDDLFSQSYYVGDKLARCSSGSALALLFKILGKSDNIV